MTNSTRLWSDGLQPDIDLGEVYRPFSDLLGDYLPMSQEDLGGKIGKDRTIISRWKSASSSEWMAGLRHQRAIVKAVRARLREIREQADKVDAMIKALEAVEAAREKHARQLDQETLVELGQANDKVRLLLKSPDE